VNDICVTIHNISCNFVYVLLDDATLFYWFLSERFLLTKIQVYVQSAKYGHRGAGIWRCLAECILTAEKFLKRVDGLFQNMKPE
jgi:hypothetical protein